MGIGFKTQPKFNTLELAARERTEKTEKKERRLETLRKKQRTKGEMRVEETKKNLAKAGKEAKTKLLKTAKETLTKKRDVNVLNGERFNI